MRTGRARAAVVPASLARLRLRLTAWYAATFFAILALLGIGIFAAITRRFDNELDESLRDASRELAREVTTEASSGRPGEAIEIARILRIPDRALYLTDVAGRSMTAVPIANWLQQLAARAAGADTANAVHVIGERILRAHAQRFSLGGGRTAVAIAVGDEVELEDRYTALIVGFSATALLAVVLVAVGGYVLARQSTVPVERAIEHMRRFMADAAHELRTPLAVMRSRAEVALGRPRAPDAYVATLRSVERETIHLARIVDDLLTLARADAGQRPIQRSRVFLDDVMLDAADAARAVAATRRVDVAVDSFEEAPVAGDPQLLRQLIMILLDNAIKFTEPGGTVRVGVVCGNDVATLAVTDTGAGIPADQLPHVFERFYRGDAARTRLSRADSTGSESAASDSADAASGGPDGVGLGLSIAQWIAEEHGALIRVESEPGQGTRVLVQFPRTAATERASSS